MSTLRMNDFNIGSHGDKDYDIPCDLVKNSSYLAIKKHDAVDNKIATAVPVSSCSTENSKKDDPPMTKKYGTILICLMTLLVGIALFNAAIVALFAFLQISKLHSEVALLQSTISGMETTEANNSTTLATSIPALESIDARFSVLSDQLIADITRLELHSAANLTNLIDQENNCLENISDSLSFINQVISQNTNSLAAILVEVVKETGYTFDSCAAIKQLSPSSPSGNYHIRASNGSALRVYCDMTRSCGNITGGWVRVAKLDMTDNTTQCPTSLELRTSPRRTCGTMDSSSGLCSSDTFTVGGLEYSTVCGRIRAYQVGTPDGFGNILSTLDRRDPNIQNLDTAYVDGVSLTHGRSPRQHIWTFASGRNEDEFINLICPCPSSRGLPPALYVGKDYFCDTAVANGTALTFDDPLWDGAGCGPQNTCCSFNSPPWFYKQLPQSTTEDLEMRVCRDEGRNNEDIAIEVVEIYVQ